MDLQAFTSFINSYQDLPTDLKDRLLLAAEKLTPDVRQQIVSELERMAKEEEKILVEATAGLKNDFKKLQRQDKAQTESKARDEEMSNLPNFNS